MTKLKDKIAIYARVSTEMVEQDTSFVAQIKYFTEKFATKYDIVQVYSDKGSGLSLKKRPQFQQMIKDAGIDLEERKGKINTYTSNRQPKFKYILTKSVSRFSRNTEITSIIRDLKQKGVFVIFDDINKSTEDAESEMLLGFLQSISQEESRNKSQIIKWGKKRSAENGYVSLQSEIYGYKANLKENTLRIIPKEAEVIRKIFDLAQEGNGARKISRILAQENKFNKKGKPFGEFNLLYILRNPKYCGLNVRNRWETIDLFNASKKREKPESEWITQETDKIDKIISKELFDKVQKEIAKRSTLKRGINIGKGELSQKIRCSVCGSFYTRSREVKIDGTIRVFYHCGNKKRNGIKACKSRNVTQEEVDKKINSFRKDSYKTSTIMIQKVLIKKLQNRKIDIINDKDRNNILEIEEIKVKIAKYESRLNNLIEVMLDAPTDTLKRVYNKKTEGINGKLKILEMELKVFETGEDKINKIIANIDMAIKAILLFEVKENMTREEFLDEVVYISVEDDRLEMITKNFMDMSKFLSVINGSISESICGKKKLIDLSNSLNI